jgi:hypothetical protein
MNQLKDQLKISYDDIVVLIYKRLYIIINIQWLLRKRYLFLEKINIKLIEGQEIKISRNGERFWVRLISLAKIRGKGIVLNNLINNPYKYRDPITFKISEITGW